MGTTGWSGVSAIASGAFTTSSSGVALTSPLTGSVIAAFSSSVSVLATPSSPPPVSTTAFFRLASPFGGGATSDRSSILSDVRAEAVPASISVADGEAEVVLRAEAAVEAAALAFFFRWAS